MIPASKKDFLFTLDKSDGKRCAQVLVYDEDDFEHWKKECSENGYLLGFSYHVEENYFGYPDPAHDVYQIFPLELENHFIEIGVEVVQ